MWHFKSKTEWFEGGKKDFRRLQIIVVIFVTILLMNAVCVNAHVSTSDKSSGSKNSEFGELRKDYVDLKDQLKDVQLEIVAQVGVLQNDVTYKRVSSQYKDRNTSSKKRLSP